MRFFNKPPLSFVGNKKNQLKNFKKVLSLMQDSGYITKDTVFYDIFGGSGLLSHETKRLFQNNKVVWNDYDNFKERLDNIESTEALRIKLLKALEIAASVYLERAYGQGKVGKNTLELIKETLKSHEGYFDAIYFSSQLLFSGDFCESKEAFLRKSFFYDRLSRSECEARGYLKGVERVQMDYKELVKKAYDESGEKAFLILDPPYLQTSKFHYSGKFWNLCDFLWLISNIKKPFIYFSSERTDILPFIEFANDDENLKNLKNLKILKNLNVLSGNLQSMNMGAAKQKDFLIYTKERGLFDT